MFFIVLFAFCYSFSWFFFLSFISLKFISYLTFKNKQSINLHMDQFRGILINNFYFIWLSDNQSWILTQIFVIYKLFFLIFFLYFDVFSCVISSSLIKFLTYSFFRLLILFHYNFFFVCFSLIFCIHFAFPHFLYCPILNFQHFLSVFLFFCVISFFSPFYFITVFCSFVFIVSFFFYFFFYIHFSFCYFVCCSSLNFHHFVFLNLSLVPVLFFRYSFIFFSTYFLLFLPFELSSRLIIHTIRFVPSAPSHRNFIPFICFALFWFSSFLFFHTVFFDDSSIIILS